MTPAAARDFMILQRIEINGAGTSSAFRPFHGIRGTIIHRRRGSSLVIELDRWPDGMPRNFEAEHKANWIVVHSFELQVLRTIEDEPSPEPPPAHAA